MSAESEILTAWASKFQRPSLEVYLNGTRTNVSGASVTYSLDDTNSTARLTFDEYPSYGGLKVDVAIHVGYDGYVAPIFTGRSWDTQRSIPPHSYQMICNGPLHKMREEYGGDPVPWIDETDTTILTDLAVLSGINQYSIEGRGVTLGTLQPIWLNTGATPWSVAERVLQDWGYKLMDSPDGTVRSRRTNGVPEDTAAFTILQGEYAFRYSRIRSIRDIRNKSFVEGLPVGYFIPQAIYQDPADENDLPHPWIDAPPGYRVIRHRSDFLETIDQCDEVAQRLMYEYNRVSERLDGVEVAGNPFLLPGMTIGLEVTALGVTSVVNYVLWSVTHEFSAQGFTSVMSLVGGVGAPGEPGDPYGDYPNPVEDPDPGSDGPEPAVTWQLSREGFLPDGAETAAVGSITRIDPVIMADPDPFDVLGDTDYESSLVTTNTTHVRLYTFNGDALGSYSPTEDPTGLTFAWSNNKNADVSGSRFYGTAFTQAEMETDADCEVYLQVTDVATNSRTLTIPLSSSDALTQNLFAIGENFGWVAQNGSEDWTEVWQEGNPTGNTVSGYSSTLPSYDGGAPVYWIKDFSPVGGAEPDYLEVGIWNSFTNLECQGKTMGSIVDVYYYEADKSTQAGTRTRTNCSTSWTEMNASFPAPAGTVWVEIRSAGTVNNPFNARFGQETTEYGDPPAFTALPEISPEDWTLFGLADGRALKVSIDSEGDITREVLASFVQGQAESVLVDAPVPEVFSGPVTGVWINESDHDRITVVVNAGNGPYVYVTTTGGVDPGGGVKAWRNIFNPGILVARGYSASSWNTVHHIIESALNPGEYRVSAGNAVWITFDEFRHVTPIAGIDLNNPPGDGRQSALSPFGNYAGFRYRSGAGRVLDEYTGDESSMPSLSGAPNVSAYYPGDLDTPPADNSAQIMAVTHHIRDEVLYAVTVHGHFLKAEAGGALTLVSTIPRAIELYEDPVDLPDDPLKEWHWGGVEHMIRHGGMPLVVYAAGAGYVHKTYNAGASWRKIIEDWSPPPTTYGASDPTPLPENAIDDIRGFTYISYGSPEWA